MTRPTARTPLWEWLIPPAIVLLGLGLALAADSWSRFWTAVIAAGALTMVLISRSDRR